MEKKSKEVKRIFKGEEQFYHDLFKLKLADMKKEQGYQPANPYYVNVEHVHFFHNITSDGKALSHAAPSGGHTHEMLEDGVDKDGHPKYKVSRALRCIKRGVYKPMAYDDHTHECQYVRSEVVTPSAPNPDFQKYRTMLANKQAEVASLETDVKEILK